MHFHASAPNNCFAVWMVLVLVFPLFVKGQKIAIIGSGVSGSFTAKYLVDYDTECSLEQIDIFDVVLPPVEEVGLGEHNNNNHKTTDELTSSEYFQGGRVASLKLGDGTIVELGASVAFDGFYFVSQMLKQAKIQTGRPFHTGTIHDLQTTQDLRIGMGIYNGNGDFPLLTSKIKSSWWKLLTFLYRYNVDLVRLKSATDRMLPSYYSIHHMLESDRDDSFFESPDEMWQKVGLSKAVHATFEELLDALGIPNELQWWRKWLPYQGNLREELLEAATLCNYNQELSKVNGFVGLGSFIAAEDDLYSVIGGNHQIVTTALEQAQQNRASKCPTNKPEIRILNERITSVIGDLVDGMELYAGEKQLGTYDTVILAAPLQQCRISFSIRSHMDGAVLQPMPLNGMVDTEQTEAEDGHDVFPKPLPDHAVRPYTQVVTTVVSNATLQADYFQIPESDLPRSILHSKKGKASNFNITTITQITSSSNSSGGGHVYKIFSDGILTTDILTQLFGPWYTLEISKVWGGPWGGATPDYQGHGQTLNYMLHDTAVGFEGDPSTKGGSLYYANAQESAFAAMELSAIAAKSVAKLIAKRYNFITPQYETASSEEL